MTIGEDGKSWSSVLMSRFPRYRLPSSIEQRSACCLSKTSTSVRLRDQKHIPFLYATTHRHHDPAFGHQSPLQYRSHADREYISPPMIEEFQDAKKQGGRRVGNPYIAGSDIFLNLPDVHGFHRDVQWQNLHVLHRPTVLLLFLRLPRTLYRDNRHIATEQICHEHRPPVLAWPPSCER